jgi:hypothetical protein
LFEQAPCEERTAMNPPQPVHGMFGRWTFITPIGNLELTKEIGGEFKIDQVLFVNRDKLTRIRKRIGLHRTISQFKTENWRRDFFDKHQTFAVIRRAGKPDDLRRTCYRIVKEELMLLNLSQLGYTRRRSVGHIALFGEHLRSTASFGFFENNSPVTSIGSRITRGIDSLVLDASWSNFQKEFFFSKLMRILHDKRSLARSWRKDLRKACLLVGQSLSTADVPIAFLLNMIALETLLTRQGDKYTDVLPSRLEAFLGWVGYWTTQQYPDRIKEVYKKRCAFVHDGSKEIKLKDLLFTDDLLFNLLVNLTNLSKLFNSKDRIIEFADKVEAEHILGVRPKVRPKQLRFFSTQYSSQDLEDLY